MLRKYAQDSLPKVCKNKNIMKNKRRQFLKQTALSALGAGGMLKGLAGISEQIFSNSKMERGNPDDSHLSVIGLYGDWAAGLHENTLPSVSFRREGWKNVEKWRQVASKRVKERMSIPDIGKAPCLTVIKQFVYDGLHVQELSWQLPYGRATEALLLKPENVTGKLPA